MKKNYTKKLSVLILAISMSALSFAQIIANGTYKIFSAVNSEVMSVNTDPAADIIVGRAKMEPNSNDDLQLWAFTHQGSDVYKIQNVGDNSILGIKDGWCGTFGDVQVGFDDSSPWVLIKVSLLSTDNYYFEIAFDSDCNFGSTNDPIKVFDIDGGSAGGKINTFREPMSPPINANQTFQILNPSTLSTTDFEDLSTIKAIYTKERGLVINVGNTVFKSLAVDVFDLTGKRIESQKFNSVDSEVALSTTALKTGLYIARISIQKNLNMVLKFVVH